jgi:hypothetical protein
MSADKLAELTANEKVTITTDSSVPLDHGKLANSKRRRVGRMLETDALATLCNRPAPGVTRTLPLCVDVSRIPIKMLAGQITRYARIAIDRPGVVSYILSPSPAPNRQGTPGRGSRHLRMGGRAPRQVVAGTRICRILGSPACGTPASSATRLRFCRLAPSDTRLRAIPLLTCAPTATRTRDLLLRRQSLYPLSYRGLPTP